MLILMRKLSYIFFLFSTIASAQLEDLGAIVGDLVFLADKYVSPAAEASVYQSSGGWYTSAKKKDLWELEISLQGNMLVVPNKSKNFVINNLDLDYFQIQGDVTSANTPTALGGSNYIVLEDRDNNGIEFDSPEGIDEAFVEHGQLQASLGLWEGTTLIGRYSPKIKINKTYYQLYGFGLQHNISQWIPSLNESSFDLAGLITYSVYSVSDNFSEIKFAGESLNSVVIDGKSWGFNLVASKQINDFNISSAVGIASSKFEYALGGTGTNLLPLLNRELGTLNESKSNFKADVGVDYRIGDFSLNTMVTIGEYTNLILGVNYNL